LSAGLKKGSVGNPERKKEERFNSETSTGRLGQTTRGNELIPLLKTTKPFQGNSKPPLQFLGEKEKKEIGQKRNRSFSQKRVSQHNTPCSVKRWTAVKARVRVPANDKGGGEPA